MTGLVDGAGRLHAVDASGAVACPSRIDRATSTAVPFEPRAAEACCRFCLIAWFASRANRGRGPITHQ